MRLAAMAQDRPRPVPMTSDPVRRPDSSELVIEASDRFRARLTVNPPLFYAIGTMVGMILLGTAAIVWTATAHRRRPTVMTRLLSRVGQR